MGDYTGTIWGFQGASSFHLRFVRDHARTVLYWKSTAQTCFTLGTAANGAHSCMMQPGCCMISCFKDFRVVLLGLRILYESLPNRLQNSSAKCSLGATGESNGFRFRVCGQAHCVPV